MASSGIDSRQETRVIKRVYADYSVQIHNWDKLTEASKSAKEDSSEPQPNKDLHKLMEVIQGAPELDKYFKTHETNRKANLVTFDTLWTLWAQGTLFYARPFVGEDQCFEIYDYSIPDRYERTRRYYSLWGWCWEWNGTKYIKVVHAFAIESFKGTREINKLDFYPLRNHKDEAGLREKLIARGNKYDEIVRSKIGSEQMWAYKGDAVFDKDPVIKKLRDDEDSSDDDAGRHRFRGSVRQTLPTKGPVVVDPEAYNQFAPSSFPLGDLNPATTIDDKEEDDDEKQESEKEAERASIVRPPRVLGYSTKEKRWGQYAVDSIMPAAKKDPEAFEKRLELGSDYKKNDPSARRRAPGPPLGHGRRRAFRRAEKAGPGSSRREGKGFSPALPRSAWRGQDSHCGNYCAGDRQAVVRGQRGRNRARRE